jgi:hypothetical protein
MSQYDIGTIDTSTTGTQLATKLGASAWPDAIETNHQGASRPSYVLDGMIWIDTSGGATAHLIKYYDGAADISLGSINRTADTFTVPGIGSIVQGYDVNTAKINVVQTWTKAQVSGETTTTFVAGGVTWGLDDNPCTKITFTANMTGTMDAGTTLRAGGTYVLRIIHSGGAWTIATWAAKFKFGTEGTPVLSTTTGAIDIFTFYCDGTNLYCIGRAQGF